MPLPPAPALTPVPLPHSRTQTYTGYAYTPAPSPSPSSLEAWRNKPQRIQAWSHAVPTPGIGGGGMSWGQGVGVGSAEWSGTTNRSKDKRTEDEEDKGTEPTTYRKGRVDKSDRAGEVVKQQRKMGSQASSIGKQQRQLGSGSGIQVNLAVPALTQVPSIPGPVPTSHRTAEIAQAERKLGSHRSTKSAIRERPGISRSTSQVNLTIPLDTRAPPIPLLALPRSPSPAVFLGPNSTGQGQRPPPRPLGSDASAESARSIRDAYIDSALHLPIEILSAKDPNPIPEAKGNEGVKKSKSNTSTKSNRDARQVAGHGAREAQSKGSAADPAAQDTGKRNANKREDRQMSGAALGSAKRGSSKRGIAAVPSVKTKASPADIGKGGNGIGKGQTSDAALGSSKSGTSREGVDRVPNTKSKAGISLESVKTWPRSIPRIDQARSRPVTVENTPYNPYLDLPTPLARHTSIDPPLPLQTFRQQPYTPIPSSSVVTAANYSPTRGAVVDRNHKSLPARRPTPAHRQPAPMLQPALSRSASSFDMQGKRRDGPDAPGLQARFEPSMYPLPASGTTTELELSPVRPDLGIHSARSLGSATSHKARRPIMIDLDPSLTPGSSYDKANPRFDHSPRPASPRLDIVSPSSDNSPPAQGDRIAFEIPSGTRGRLRVSLAWFRDVKSPSKRWKDRIHVRGSRRASVDEDSQPPPLPSKDWKWSDSGNMSRDQGFRSSSPEHQGDRYRPTSPRGDRYLPPPPPSPRLPHRYSPLPRPVERERDRVRFSPEPPPNIPRIPNAWKQVSNPYLTVPGTPGLAGSFAPPDMYRPNALRPFAPFQAYPQQHPNAWAAMSLPNLYHLSGPPTQAPPSPRPSIDPPADTSPPRMPHTLPEMYRSKPLNYPAPMSMAYPQPNMSMPYGYKGTDTNGQNGYRGTNGLPWSGRLTMSQRMFRRSGRDDDDRWDQARNGKEGLIRNWRRNIQSGRGTTPFGNGYRQNGNREPEQGYRFGGDRRGWLSLPGFRQRTRRDAQDIRNGTTHVQPSRVPSPIRNPRERAKEERRAQRQYRRDKRDLMPQTRDARTLHPDDSVTRAAGATGRPELGQRGRSGRMVKDWVERVSRPARDRNLRVGKSEDTRKEGTSWKKRLELRQRGREAGTGGKLRRSNSRKQAKNGIGRFMASFSLERGRGMQ